MEQWIETEVYKSNNSSHFFRLLSSLSPLPCFVVKLKSCKKPQNASFSCTNEIRDVHLDSPQSSVHFKRQRDSDWMCLDWVRKKKKVLLWIAVSTKGTKCIADICKSLHLNIAFLWLFYSEPSDCSGSSDSPKNFPDCFDSLEMRMSVRKFPNHCVWWSIMM